MSKYIKLDDIKKYPIRLSHYDHEHGNSDFVLGIKSLMEYIDQLSTEEIPQQLKSMRWRMHTGSSTKYEFLTCSRCGKSYYTGANSTEEAKQKLKNGEAYEYCSHCGAVMDESEGEHA